MQFSYANNKVYFTNFCNELNSGEHYRTFYDYFMTIDLTIFDFIVLRPNTKISNDIKELDTPTLARFLERIVDYNNKDIRYSLNKFF